MKMCVLNSISLLTSICTHTYPGLSLLTPRLNQNAGLITNFEVYQWLERQRLRNKANKRGTKDIVFVEKQVRLSPSSKLVIAVSFLVS